MKAIICSQCGANDLVEVDGNRLKCSYCGTLFDRAPEASAPENAPPKATVQILKGAHVVFGPHAHVVIRGGLKIDEGADVQVDGDLSLLEKSPRKGTPSDGG